MLLLNLLLFMMGLQAEAPTPVVQTTPTTQTGYTQRPSNARTQTYNRYLDSFTIYNPFVLADWIVDVVESNLNIVGKLAFRPKAFTYSWDSWIGLEIPVDWTYLMNWYIELQESDTASLYVAYLRDWTVYVMWFNWVFWGISIWQLVPVTWTFNLRKWDIIRYEKGISDWFSAWISITVTKLN